MTYATVPGRQWSSPKPSFQQVAKITSPNTGFQKRSWTVNWQTDNGEFPVNPVNPLGYGETWSFDPGFGGPASRLDANGNTTSWTYDGFGNPTMTKIDGTTDSVSVVYCNGINGGTTTCPTHGAFLVVTTHLGKDGSTETAPQTNVYYDALGRVIAQDITRGATARAQTVYDTNGFIEETCPPYILGDHDPQWTVYTPDDLGRPENAELPNGSTSAYTYSGLTTSVMLDSGGSSQETTTTTRNDEGLVANVQDANGGNTSYAYDAFGDPIAVTTPGGASITNSFDVRGRKTGSSDPDMGNWSYGYDPLNALWSQTDPKGNPTTLAYDLVGRLLSRTEPDMTASWHYDGQNGQADAIGQIDMASCLGTACAGGNYYRTYAYDSFERPQSLAIQYGTTINGGTTFTSSETYDAVTGLLENVTDFSGFQYTYQYNTAGLVKKIVNTANPGTVYWAPSDRDAFGRVTDETAGNGIETIHTFYPQTGNLEQIAAGPSDSIANLTYGWDAVGNLTSRTDSLQSYAENFCDDSLNRLTAYAVDQVGSGDCTSGSIEKTIGYDDGVHGDGDITGKSDAAFTLTASTMAGRTRSARSTPPRERAAAAPFRPARSTASRIRTSSELVLRPRLARTGGTRTAMCCASPRKPPATRRRRAATAGLLSTWRRR